MCRFISSTGCVLSPRLPISILSNTQGGHKELYFVMSFFQRTLPSLSLIPSGKFCPQGIEQKEREREGEGEGELLGPPGVNDGGKVGGM